MNDMDIRKIIKEEIDKVVKGKYLVEYLDKDFGVPLYNAAKKEFGDAQVVKTTWLVHSFTGNLAKEIMDNGFSNGLSKDALNRHDMTWATGKHEDNGYSWAYKAEDFMITERRRKTNYGPSILFQASGVEYLNPVDGNKQVMFYNKSAKNRILIYEWDGEENIRDKFPTYHRKENLYAVGNINGKPLYIGYFGDVIEWCITNFAQYRKNLLGNDEVLHSSDKTEYAYEDYLDNQGYGTLPSDSINKYEKWHDWKEEQDDILNYNSFMEKAYEEYVKAQNWDRELERDKIINRHKELGYEAPDEAKLEKILDVLKPSYSDFLKQYQGKSAFYHRRRPDNRYWRR